MYTVSRYCTYVSSYPIIKLKANVEKHNLFAVHLIKTR